LVDFSWASCAMVCFPDCWEEGFEGSFPRAVDQRLPKASVEGFGAVGCYKREMVRHYKKI
jgi:hypothetical protein